MGLKNINSSQRGFTIVELLIVVVVIAILAAITIVSYTGITQQANDSAAKAAASTLSKKAELYYADQSDYPTWAELSAGTATGEAWYVPSATFSTAPSGTNLSAAPADPDVLDYCQDANGAVIGYWDFTNGSRAFLSLGDGDCTD